MKKILIGLGLVFVVLIVVVGGLVGFAAYKGSGLDKSSEAYVESIVQPIMGDWSTDELKKRASPEFDKVASDADLKRVFNEFRKLGPLTNSEKPSGQASSVYFSGTGARITAKYEIKANFQNGKALVKVELIQHDEQWQVLSFYVGDAHLIAPPVEATPAPAVTPAAEAPVSNPAPDSATNAPAVTPVPADAPTPSPAATP